jgi:hypothetical protein
MNFETVRKLASALPGVEQGTMYGSPAVKVRGKLMACLPIHRSAEPGSLAVRIAFEDRTALLKESPETYYLTDHYVDSPVVLVRLSKIGRDALKDLLATSWKFAGAQKHGRKGNI